MDKLKKLSIILIFLALVLTININKVNASSDSDLYLNNLKFDAKINEDGSMDVVEYWDIDIEDTNTLYKAFKLDRTKFSNISNVNVKEVTNNSNKQFKESYNWAYHLPKDTFYGGLNKDRDFEIAWGVSLEDKEATRQYEISYTVEDAIAKYSDYSELYWQFIGEDFKIGAKNIVGTITLPESATKLDDIKVWGHTEDLNGEIYVTDLNKIEFNLRDYRGGRYVEIRTLFPTEMIAISRRTSNNAILDSVIQEETKWAIEANQRRATRDTIRLVITIVISIICIIPTIFLIRNTIKLYKQMKALKKYEVEQKIEYFREVPRENATPAEAVFIYKKIASEFSGTDLGNIFSATLLDLSLKNIIEFEQTKDDINIKILTDDTSKISENKDELEIFNYLKYACNEKSDTKKEITVKNLKKYISSKSVVSLAHELMKETKNSLIKNDILNNEELEQYKHNSDMVNVNAILIMFALFFGIASIAITNNLIIATVILIFIITLIVNIIIRIKSNLKINIHTQKGIEECEQWKALKKYMEDFSMLDKREVPELVIWEKFLVYATAFGIADKVIKQLKVVYPNINENMDLNTYAYMNLMVNTNFAQSFSSAISSSMSSSYSSATGGGGGFSGGGGRRPVGGGGGRRQIDRKEENKMAKPIVAIIRKTKCREINIF